MSNLNERKLVIGNVALSFEAQKEKPDFKQKYAKKSWFTFEQYTPQAIQKLLNQYSKHYIVHELSFVSYKVLNAYIKKHNLTYTTPAKRNKEKLREYQKDYRLLAKKSSQEKQQKTNLEEVLTPLERFKKEFEKRKQKRIRQILQNPYHEYN